MSKEILFIMGSNSDLPKISAGLEILKEFSVETETRISSAHRTPERTVEIVRAFEKQGGKIIIAAAGMSAHLAGVIAAHSLLPVIGIPLSSAHFAGQDSLLSMIEMPPGVPVAVTGHGKSGAKNAALFAVSILALSKPHLKERLLKYRNKMADAVIESDKTLVNKGWEKSME